MITLVDYEGTALGSERVVCTCECNNYDHCPFSTRRTDFQTNFKPELVFVVRELASGNFVVAVSCSDRDPL